MKCLKHKWLRLFWRDVRQAFRALHGWTGRNWSLLLTTWLVVIGAGIVYLLPQDDALLHSLRSRPAQSRTAANDLARNLSYYGDFVGFNLGTFFILQVVGWWRRSRRLQRVAVASLLCASLSGLSANVVRMAAGRPRPSTQARDVLHGPTLDFKYQSLASAHTATAFGGALPVLQSVPVVGVPLTTIAVGVGWSRLHLNRHHPTDVLVSFFIAFMFSIPLSRWALGRRPSAKDFRSHRFSSHAISLTRRAH